MLTSLQTFFVHILIAVGIIASPIAVPTQQAIVPSLAQEATTTTTVSIPVITKSSVPQKQTVVIAPPQVQQETPAPIVIPTSTPVAQKQNAECGRSTNRTLDEEPTELCKVGEAGSVSVADSSYIWTCSGIAGGRSTSCSANKITDGVCGSMANTITSTIDSSKLCSAGTSSGVSYNLNQIGWTCGGDFGGEKTSCYAIRALK